MEETRKKEIEEGDPVSAADMKNFLIWRIEKFELILIDSFFLLISTWVEW